MTTKIKTLQGNSNKSSWALSDDVPSTVSNNLTSMLNYQIARNKLFRYGRQNWNDHFKIRIEEVTIGNENVWEWNVIELITLTANEATCCKIKDRASPFLQFL